MVAPHAGHAQNTRILPKTLCSVTNHAAASYLLTKMAKMKTTFRNFSKIGCRVAAFCPLLAALWLVLPTQTWADESLQLQPLIEEALKNRPALRASYHEASAKEAEIGPKGAYEDPMVGLTAMNYPKDTLAQGEFGMTGNELAVSQKIPFPGKLTKLRNAARHEFESKTHEYSQKKLDLIKEVKVAFYELFLAHKKRDILNDQIGMLGQLIAVMRSKYTLGKVPQAELLGLQSEEANLRDQLLGAEKLIETKTGDLNYAIGRDSHGLLPKPEKITKTAIDLSKVTEPSLLQRISFTRPGLKAVHSELESAESKLSFAKWDYLPNFEFRLAYTQRVPSPGDRGVDLLSGGVALSVPIWALTKQSEEVRRAASEKAKAESLVDEERIHVSHEVHSRYSDLREADKRVKLYEGGLLPLARQAEATARSAYLTGRIEYSAVINLIRNRFQTEFNYSEALVSYESKIAEFEALLGEPLGAQQ